FSSDCSLYGTTYGIGNTLQSPIGTVFKVTTNGVLTTLVSFSNTNGANPSAVLVLGSDGNFYGTTSWGGSSNRGTVFQVTTAGALTTLVSFTGTDGNHPDNLVIGSDGNFYGTTAEGCVSNGGTVFRMTNNGVLTTLATNGMGPNALTLGSDRNLYDMGKTVGSGIGTVFKVTTSGVFSTLVSFSNTNGANPAAGLVLG